MAVVSGAKAMSIIAKPRVRAACSTPSSAYTVVGTLGPQSLGSPNPWQLTS
jgi:hypothetical protein